MQVTDRDIKAMRLAAWCVPKPADPSPSAPSYAVVFQRKRTGHEYPEWEAAAFPILVPLGRTLAGGGRAAERAVVERVVQALAPMRREGAEQKPASQVGVRGTGGHRGGVWGGFCF